MTTNSLSQHYEFLAAVKNQLRLQQEKQERQEEAEIMKLDELKATILEDNTINEPEKEKARNELNRMLLKFDKRRTSILTIINEKELIISKAEKESLEYKAAVYALKGFTSELEKLNLKIELFTIEKPANQNGGKKKKRSRKTSKRRRH
jgi:hypothetical protein